jgi:16S rRNA (cytidine1402-2'-O)-methyltransferase
MNALKQDNGKIFIVATPIGNLDDLSFRAINTLKTVDLILAEDTRHANVLLQHYQIHTPIESFHAHNEQKKAEHYLNMVQKGTQLALISDAGTPLISDPGYPLVAKAREQNIEVIPIPGPCAVICALSAAGIPTDSFSFHGFPPSKKTARLQFFQDLSQLYHTCAFYESTHRVLDSLEDLSAVFGLQQPIILAKELTKAYEQIQLKSIEDMLIWLHEDSKRTKGEFVIIIPPREKPVSNQQDTEELMKKLLKHLGPKQASQIGHELTGIAKNQLYQMSLKLQNN